jgi:ABC-2 type transport system ATP-binding protein
MLPDTPLLEISDVSAGYTSIPVISGISFALNGGETFGLVGLNGTGKTTLIKSVLALRDTFNGEIKINGAPNYTSESKSIISYLPENFVPPSFLNGHEFLRFCMRMYGRKYDKDKADRIAQDLALDPGVLESRIFTYSKGMRQKLGIMSVVLANTRLLVLDEPMSGLDPKARVLVKDVLGKVRREGKTVFLSSHILSDMTEICDTVAVLHEGTILFKGSPETMSRQDSGRNLERAFLKMVENTSV